MKEILIHNENLKYRIEGNILRRELLQLGRPHICEHCNNDGHWNGQPIILEVDHIDSNWKNNEPNNLRFLCPNCHSQTPSFYNQKHPDYYKYCECGKWIHKTSTRCSLCNKKSDKLYLRKVDRPSKEDLQVLVNTKPISLIAKDYGISDKAVHKWCEKEGIVKLPRGHWLKKNSPD